MTHLADVLSGAASMASLAVGLYQHAGNLDHQDCADHFFLAGSVRLASPGRRSIVLWRRPCFLLPKDRHIQSQYDNVRLLALVVFQSCPEEEGSECYARGRFVDTSRKIALRLPQAYCEFCTTRTPHVHERLAINGAQVARSVCFTCKRERPKEQPQEPRS
ncbi:hypothetical protein ACVW1C_003000 [Bradyrhizobium sp. USDA 4011]